MAAPIAAVVAVQGATGQTIAHLVLRRDGTLEHYGDASTVVEVLALLLQSLRKIDARPQA